MNKPTGLVTFLFTDIEGSTKLSQEFPDSLQSALDRHHSIMHKTIENYNGFVFKIVGDAFCVAFQNVDDAVKAATDAQLYLAEEKWDHAVIKVRMGIHSGNTEWNGNNYMGYITLARTARVMSTAYGEQILISNDAYELCKYDFAFESKDINSNISFRDLGERRLKDVIQPIRLYQVMVPGLREDFPPLKSLDARPNNLPVQLTSFIGREEVMKEVKNLFSDTRILTLIGSGGAGKSRLAMQVGADMIDDFANGVFIAELAPINDPSFIQQTLMNSFGIKEKGGKTSEETLKVHLNNKELLLILDNCEHLIKACAETAEMLLSSSNKLKIIATSRESMNCTGEKTYRVPSLTLPDVTVNNTPFHITQYESVRLFIERALAINTEFRVNNENSHALAEICMRLDGIPLAIELAAARIKILSVEKICERLTDRFSLLSGGKRTALPRQQTLKAMIDWSYDLLSGKEKILWERLSVFAGGWTLESAEEICSDENINELEILDLLNMLTEKSIIIYNIEKERYRILETLKQYGEAKLRDSNEKDKIMQKFLTYFLLLAEKAGQKLNSSEIQIWIEKLETEHGNFQYAIEWSLSSGETEKGARLAVALGNYWDIRGFYSTGRQFLNRFLINSQAINNSLLMKVLRFLGILSTGQCDYEQARKYFVDCLALSREIGEKHGIAKSLNQLGGTIYFLEEYEQAQKYYEESLLLYRELDDKDGLAACLHNFGNTLSGLGKFEQGKNYLEESHALRVEIKDKRGMASCLLSLGLITYNQDNNDYMKAINLYEDSVAISREIGLKLELAISLFNIGDCLESNDYNYERAVNYFEEALGLFREIGHKTGIANSLHGLGNIAFRQSDFEKAKKLFTESLEIRRETGNKHAVINSLNRLGSAVFSTGNYEEAKKYYKECLQLGRDIIDKTGIVTSLTGIAGILVAENNNQKSAQLLGSVDKVIKSKNTLLGKNAMNFSESITNLLREKISDEEFEIYFEEGKNMTPEEVVDFILEDKL